MEKTLGMLEIVSLRGMINALKRSEANSVPVVKLCENYLAKLDNGVCETLLCESFINDLANIATTDSIKDSLKSINESVNKYRKDIDVANAIFNLSNSPYAYVAPVLENLVAEYLSNKCQETRDAALEQLSLFENVKNVKFVMDSLRNDAYDESQGRVLLNAPVKGAFVAESEKTYTQAEVDAMIAEKEAAAPVVEAEAPKKTASDIESHIGLNGVIRNILKKCDNEKVKVVCEQYLNALNQGRDEVLLYESFVSSIAPWNYLSAVDTQLSALSDRVSKYKQDIDLKKILETMKSTGSYYIVPLIEDLVADYVDNKNMTNRVVLRNRLTPFEHDPFVRDIISIINDDLSLENTVYLGESVEALNNYVHTEYVYSPVQYIKENECVFNVKGTYYVKKGNSISKMKNTNELSESFKSLCRLVNDKSVVVSSNDNTIAVYDGNDVAVISESAIVLNNTAITVGELDSLYESAVNMRDDKAVFYGNVKALNEGFDNIAYINFVKRVVADDGSRRAVDVFKLKNKIFVDCIDENLKASTFYRDVNPIACRSIINEHMEINVAPLFEDELPDQKGIEAKLDKKGKEYENLIEELESKKAELEEDKSEEGVDKEEIDELIASIDKEIEDTKSAYNDYKAESDKFINGDKNSAENSLDDEIPFDDEPADDSASDDMKDPEGDKMLSDESPEDMEQPIEGEPELPAEDGGEDEFKDVPYYDGMFDAPAASEEGDDAKFSIVKVSYAKNLKTKAANAQGEVIVLIPMIDSNGDIHNDMKKITFMIGDDQMPIINNEYMPLDMYEAIIDAIESCPATAEAKSMSANGQAPLDAAKIQAPVDASIVAPAAPAEQNAADDIDDADIDAIFNDIDEPSADAPDENPAAIEINMNGSEQAPEDASVNYPIEIGLDVADIKPIGKDDFEESLDDMGIAHTAVEGCEGGICFTVNNKAEAHAIRKYFKEWKNFSNGEFDNFFPELKKCFDNNSSTIPVMKESVEIKGVRAISESAKALPDGRINIMLPATKDYCKMFGIDYNENRAQIQIITESAKESEDVYGKLYVYSKKMNESVDADAKDFLEKYAPLYESAACKNNVFELNVPFNNILESKLESKGFVVKTNGDRMSAEILSPDFAKAKKLLEGFYGKQAPSSVKDFFQVAALNENVKITVRDESTGKVVEINTDDALDDKKDSAEGAADFGSSFENVTFDPKDSLAFQDDEESAEDEDEKDDEKKEDGENESDEKKDDKDTESEEKDEEKDSDSEKKEEPKKSKFKFKVKKASKESNESLKSRFTSKIVESEGTKAYSKPRVLSESAVPTVLDFVKCSNGQKGQIIAEMANGDYIVNVSGHTLIYDRKSVAPLNPRPDTLDVPFKYDPETLKGLYEQMVECGLFMNDMQLTPADTYVKFSDYVNAKDNEEIRLVIEGEETKATRKYIRLTESVDAFANIFDYKDATINNRGINESVLANVRDYEKSCGSSNSVRCLIKDNDNWTLCEVPAGLVSIN